MGGRCAECGAKFGANVWDLVLRRGACPHCGGRLEPCGDPDERGGKPPQEDDPEQA
jgi:hypothetical protein